MVWQKEQKKAAKLRVYDKFTEGCTLVFGYPNFFPTHFKIAFVLKTTVSLFSHFNGTPACVRHTLWP